MKFKKKHEHKAQSNKVIEKWDESVYPFPIKKINPIYSKCIKPSKTKEEIKQRKIKWKSVKDANVK